MWGLRSAHAVGLGAGAPSLARRSLWRRRHPGRWQTRAPAGLGAGRLQADAGIEHCGRVGQRRLAAPQVNGNAEKS